MPTTVFSERRAGACPRRLSMYRLCLKIRIVILSALSQTGQPKNLVLDLVGSGFIRSAVSVAPTTALIARTLFKTANISTHVPILFAICTAIVPESSPLCSQYVPTPAKQLLD